MVWITKNENRVKLEGTYILKVKGKEVDRFSSLKEAKKEADRLGGEVWLDDFRVYSARETFIEEPEQTIINRSSKKSRKPKSIVKKPPRKTTRKKGIYGVFE